MKDGALSLAPAHASRRRLGATPVARAFVALVAGGPLVARGLGVMAPDTFVLGSAGSEDGVRGLALGAAAEQPPPVSGHWGRPA